MKKLLRGFVFKFNLISIYIPATNIADNATNYFSFFSHPQRPESFCLRLGFPVALFVAAQWIDKKPHRRYSNIAQGRSRSWNIRLMLCFFTTVWIVDEDNVVRHHKIECKYPGIYWINNPEEPLLLTLVPTKSSRVYHPSTDLPNFHIDAWQHQKIYRFVRHRLDIDNIFSWTHVRAHVSRRK